MGRREVGVKWSLLAQEEEHDDEPWAFLLGAKFLDELNDYQIIRKNLV